MNKDAFIEEMLQEVKSIKDLAKEELPAIAKEYVRAKIVMYGVGIMLSLVAITIGISCGLYALLHTFPETYNGHDNQMGISAVGLITGAVGCVFCACNLYSFLEFKLQPRRMAIKAITSLKD